MVHSQLSLIYGPGAYPYSVWNKVGNDKRAKFYSYLLVAYFVYVWNMLNTHTMKKSVLLFTLALFISVTCINAFDSDDDKK